jgi:hypothetical protein
VSEDWKQLVAASERVFHDLEGMTYEYSEVGIYRHPSGRFFSRNESLHVDADHPRIRFSWVEDPESLLAKQRQRVAERDASGKQAFFDIHAEQAAAAQNTQPAPAQAQGPTASPGVPMASQTLTDALTALLTRTGGFVIAADAGGRFVQFAGGVGEPLLMDVPKISAEEGVRAATAFAGQPFTVSGDTFNLGFGEDAAAASAAAMTFFQQVLGVATPQLTFTEE